MASVVFKICLYLGNIWDRNKCHGVKITFTIATIAAQFFLGI